MEGRMTTKLTLRLDNASIRMAKKTARTRGISLSRMVEDYFKSVARQEESRTKESPVLAEIAGVLYGRSDTEKLKAAYERHLAKKYM